MITQTKPSKTRPFAGGETIADFIVGDAPLRVTLTRADGERLDAQLPPAMARALAEFLREREREERKAALAELTRYSEEIGLYELEEK